MSGPEDLLFLRRPPPRTRFYYCLYGTGSQRERRFDSCPPPPARPCTKESFGARPPAEIKEMYSTTALRTNAKQKPTSLCYEYLAPLLLPVITAFRQAHELRMERISAAGRGRTGVGLSSIHDGGTIKRNGEKKEGGGGEKRGEAFQNPRFSFHLLFSSA